MAFFQKVQFVSKIKIFQKTILSLKFKIPANYSICTIIGRKFKFQVQDSFLEYFFLEIWILEKHFALSEKKPPLVHT